MCDVVGDVVGFWCESASCVRLRGCADVLMMEAKGEDNVVLLNIHEADC